jgi:hypothetical protein
MKDATGTDSEQRALHRDAPYLPGQDADGIHACRGVAPVTGSLFLRSGSWLTPGQPPVRCLSPPSLILAILFPKGDGRA